MKMTLEKASCEHVYLSVNVCDVLCVIDVCMSVSRCVCYSMVNLQIKSV